MNKAYCYCYYTVSLLFKFIVHWDHNPQFTQRVLAERGLRQLLPWTLGVTALAGAQNILAAVVTQPLLDGPAGAAVAGSILLVPPEAAAVRAPCPVQLILGTSEGGDAGSVFDGGRDGLFQLAELSVACWGSRRGGLWGQLPEAADGLVRFLHHVVAATLQALGAPHQVLCLFLWQGFSGLRRRLFLRVGQAALPLDRGVTLAGTAGVRAGGRWGAQGSPHLPEWRRGQGFGWWASLLSADCRYSGVNTVWRRGFHTTVWVRDYTTVWVRSHATVWVRSHATVWVRHHASVWLRSHTTVWLRCHTTIWLRCHTTVWMRCHTTAWLWGHATVWLRCPVLWSRFCTGGIARFGVGRGLCQWGIGPLGQLTRLETDPGSFVTVTTVYLLAAPFPAISFLSGGLRWVSTNSVAPVPTFHPVSHGLLGMGVLVQTHPTVLDLALAPGWWVTVCGGHPCPLLGLLHGLHAGQGNIILLFSGQLWEPHGGSLGFPMQVLGSPGGKEAHGARGLGSTTAVAPVAPPVGLLHLQPQVPAGQVGAVLQEGLTDHQQTCRAAHCPHTHMTFWWQCCNR